MTVSLELLSRGPATPDLLEDLVATGPALVATLARWSVSAPATVPARADTGVSDPDEVAEVLAAGTPAVVDVAAGLRAVGAESGPGPAAEQLIDLLAVAAHSGVGFGSGLVPKCDDAAQVWALISGSVAAMTGGDVVSALVHPDPAKLLALSRSAREAIRDVITCVVVPEDARDAVSADLASAHGV